MHNQASLERSIGFSPAVVGSLNSSDNSTHGVCMLHMEIHATNASVGVERRVHARCAHGNTPCITRHIRKSRRTKAAMLSSAGGKHAHTGKAPSTLTACLTLGTAHASHTTHTEAHRGY